jgi:ATP-binding cassette subfamily F protein 3
MLDDAGLLLLDEPTNHLDIPAQEMLEDALNDFEGTILFVSHDRYFIDAIATRLWVIEDGAVSMHLGNYSDLERYRRRIVHGMTQVDRRPGSASKPLKTPDHPMPTISVEEQIDALEREVSRIEAELADGQTYDDPNRVTELARAHDEASRRLRSLYQEWEQAADG